MTDSHPVIVYKDNEPLPGLEELYKQLKDGVVEVSCALWLSTDVMKNVV